MKIALASDLHLEFGDIELKNTKNADVLLLSGDIMVAQDLHDFKDDAALTASQRQKNAKQYRDFLQRCSQEFPHVIYIAGNHEFYHGKWIESLKDLKKETLKFNNVYFLEDEVKVIDGVTFIGCTLWTDMNKNDPMTLHAVGDMMNDFRLIRHDELGYTRVRPAHAASRHLKSLKFIKHVVEGKANDKFVVVGHHAPSKLSTKPQYEKDYLMNGAYSSDLSEFIMDHPQIKIWTHGHTHHPFDYMVGSTRIVCNPRGYIGYEYQAESFELQYLDI